MNALPAGMLQFYVEERSGECDCGLFAESFDKGETWDYYRRVVWEPEPAPDLPRDDVSD